MTAAGKERLALDLAVAALTKVQRLAAGGASVADIEEAATRALASVGHLEAPGDDPEDETPSLAHLPAREAERLARREEVCGFYEPETATITLYTEEHGEES